MTIKSIKHPKEKRAHIPSMGRRLALTTKA